MFESKLLSLRLRACGFARTLFVAVIVLNVISCAAPTYKDPWVFKDNPIAVLGVVGNSSVFYEGKRLVLASYIEEFLADESRYSHIPYRVVRENMGDFHDDVLYEYMRYGDLSDETIGGIARAVAASGVAAQYALVLRIDKNEVYPKSNAYSKEMEIITPIRDNQGLILRDRVHRTLARERHVVVVANVYDVLNGDLVWQKTFESKPKVVSSRVDYSGSSFAGSVTATVANMFANGAGRLRLPAPPAENRALKAAFREVIHYMFNGDQRI